MNHEDRIRVNEDNYLKYGIKDLKPLSIPQNNNESEQIMNESSEDSQNDIELFTE